MGDFHNIFKNLRMQNHYTQGQMADRHFPKRCQYV